MHRLDRKQRLLSVKKKRVLSVKMMMNMKMVKVMVMNKKAMNMKRWLEVQKICSVVVVALEMELLVELLMLKMNRMEMEMLWMRKVLELME
jgi:hypothetical protein